MRTYHRARRRRRNRALPRILLLLVILGALGILLITGVGKNESVKETANTGYHLENTLNTASKRSMDNGDEKTDPWYLILVNKDHPIPADYQVELTALDNGTQIDERIYPDLQAMFDAARAQGLQLFVRDGYRTQEEQQQILEERIAAYEAEGYDSSQARQLALEWVALPGTSEHQLGIAVDINPDMVISTTDDVYGWLAENAYKYGFIKRYPEDKVAITGVSNEPWHYRYVGPKAAAEIAESGLCLEEYLEK